MSAPLHCAKFSHNFLLSSDELYHYSSEWQFKDMLYISNLAAQEINQELHEIYIIYFVFIQMQTSLNI